MRTTALKKVSLESQPGYAIRRLHQVAVAIFSHEIGELGITPVQYAILQMVHNHPGFDQRTLARNIALDTSTTAGVVDRLEARGVLTRNASPSDRRVRLLSLTPAGEQLLVDTIPRMENAQQRILAPLSPAQQAEFMHLLHLLLDKNHDQSQRPVDTVNA
ncbi:MarR family winged helix-turn-helix transcriptional regulator [Rhodoferax sp.]|uniref:MarR family winged helix-turn-helix transcriptional regulator n=1 Tax=Rhodoferax sp. TaxID=50421 RepID=UPI002636704B|nr:MarR family transcriptional regulator [Rhodoferax sp.]MDD3936485.1 MarR family transcriptional regulator [Rhodoferax sp.]